VHLSIILFNDQLDTHLFFVYVYFNSLHVLSIEVLIIRRFSWSIWYLVYVTLCRWLSGMQVWMELHPNLHIRWSPA